MILPDDVRSAIAAHSRATLPEEACGLLASDGEGRVRLAYCLTNIDRSPHRFTVDPDEHHAALLDSERRGWHISGSFHSHPTSAPVPSRADIAGALDPSWVYLIAGPVAAEPIDIRAYRIVGGSVTELTLVGASAS